jgi:hypothetical protein
MISKTPIVSNGEEFTPRTCMGVEILTRDSDGYVNATKMGSRNKRITEYINAPPKKNR